MSQSGELSRLQQLHHWLTLEGSTAAFGGAGFFMPLGLIYIILFWGAILFTPYMLWQLYKCKKYGWIKGFVLLVGLPLVATYFVERATITGFLLSSLPLIMFYVYTWALRYSVGEWLEELRWKRRDAIQQRYRR